MSFEPLNAQQGSPEDPKCRGLRGSCSTGSWGVLEPDLLRLAPVMLPRCRSTLLGLRRELNLQACTRSVDGYAESSFASATDGRVCSNWLKLGMTGVTAHL